MYQYVEIHHWLCDLSLLIVRVVQLLVTTLELQSYIQ